MNLQLYCYSAFIDRVIDGDSVVAVVDLGFSIKVKMYLRLLGIDAPEIIGVSDRQPGLDAKAFLNDLVASGLNVIVKTHKDREDKYGRMLAELFLYDGMNVNQRMIEAGHAKPYDGGKRS